MDENKNIYSELQEIKNQLEEQKARIEKLEGSTGAGTVFQAAVPPSPPPPYHPTQEQESAVPSAPQISLEEKIGMKWLPMVGIFALVIGISFFLKYAFDNNWVGPTGRVILGVLGGIILLGIGEFLRKKYLVYSQILSGGGIAILYLSIYASYAWYNMVGAPFALVLMSLVTAASGFLSIWIGQPSLVVIGIVGGFVTPILLSTGKINTHVLFPYLIILDAGILGVSFFKQWRPLNLLGLVGTLILSSLAFVLYQGDKMIFAAYQTTFFLIFVTATISHNIIKKFVSKFFDTIFLLAASVIYFLFVYNLYESHEIGLSFFAFVLAVFYFFIALLSYYYNREDKQLAFFAPGLSVGFLTVSLGLMFSQQWITISWAVEAAVLIWISFQLAHRNFRIFGLVMLTFVALRLVFLDSFIVIDEKFLAFFNKRFLAFLISIGAVGFSAWIFAKSKDTLKDDEKKMIVALIIAANILTIMTLSQEVYAFYQKGIITLRKQKTLDQRLPAPPAPSYQKEDYFPLEFETHSNETRSMRNRQSISLSILWALYSAVLVALGFARKSRLLRLSGILLFGITITKIFLFDLWNLGQLYRIISSIALGIILLVTFFMYHKYRERLKAIL